MITLIIVFCLSAAPGVCQEVRFDDFPPDACVGSMLPQTLAAQWLGDHPKYTWDQHWRCTERIRIKPA